MYHNVLLHTIKCYKSYVINYNKLNITLNLYGCLYIYNIINDTMNLIF